MNSEALLVIGAACYFGLFFLSAWLTEKGHIPQRLVQHSGLYVLSLGIIVSSWSFYTVYLSAASRGYGYNSYYIGFAAAFLLSPLLLRPLLRITQRFQLASLADLVAFRFRSPWAGTMTTLVLLLCALPLLALQILAVAASASLLAPALPSTLVALVFCLALAAFALRFGMADVAGREPNNSLVVSLALEAVFKLGVLLATGLFVIFGVFDGFSDLQAWLDSQPVQLARLQQPYLQDSTNLVILLFFTAAIAMPHVFHMIFPENRNPGNLRTASWGVPLYLLLASLPVLPILWAYDFLGQHDNVQYAPLLMLQAVDAPLLGLLYFMGGIAAAGGLSIVLAISIANMCMNHILLRTLVPPAGTGLYDWLMLRRRALIVGIIACSFLSYLLIADGSLVLATGYISFIAAVQFLPGLLTLLYWPPANSKGFLAGLCGGLLVWGAGGLVPLAAGTTVDWNAVMASSLLTNLSLLLLFSTITTTSDEERTAALLCSPEVAPTARHALKARSVADFITSLSAPMGAESAGREVAQALRDLHLSSDETRPYPLLQLRSQLEANLSALLGPTLAHDMIEQHLPVVAPGPVSAAGMLSLLEQGVESWQGNLSGIALDLDWLRRHHRQVLQSLPLAVCELDDRGRIALWNSAMTKLTGLAADDVSGQPLTALPPPWQALLVDFTQNNDLMRLNRQSVQHNGRTRWLALHKAQLAPQAATTRGHRPAGTYLGQIVLLEDQTDTTLMEKELAHADRLNSIGRLAAGVAHEIGNPVTAIACLAQNLRDEYDNADLQAAAASILAQTRRIASITDALLRFSHSGPLIEKPPTLGTVDLHKAANEAISLFALQQDAPLVQLVNTCEPGLSVRADYQQIIQVLLNLLGNARDASPPGGTVTITTSRMTASTRLEVRDQGCGIPPAVLPRVFEPFFTTKDPGKGTGLGLALVYRLVTDLGGSIGITSWTVDSCPQGASPGTSVTVTFPSNDAGNLVTEPTASTSQSHQPTPNSR